MLKQTVCTLLAAPALVLWQIATHLEGQVPKLGTFRNQLTILNTQTIYPSQQSSSKRLLALGTLTAPAIPNLLNLSWRSERVIYLGFVVGGHRIHRTLNQTGAQETQNPAPSPLIQWPLQLCEDVFVKKRKDLCCEPSAVRPVRHVWLQVECLG